MGLCDSIWQTQMLSLIGSLYPDNSAPAFAYFKLLEVRPASFKLQVRPCTSSHPVPFLFRSELFSEVY